MSKDVYRGAYNYVCPVHGLSKYSREERRAMLKTLPVGTKLVEASELNDNSPELAQFAPGVISKLLSSSRPSLIVIGTAKQPTDDSSKRAADMILSKDSFLESTDKWGAEFIKFLRKKGFLRSTIGECYWKGLNEFPIRVAKTICCFDDSLLDEVMPKIVTKSMWVTAMRYTAAIIQADTDDEDYVYPEVNVDNLPFVYCLCLSSLMQQCFYDVAIKKLEGLQVEHSKLVKSIQTSEQKLDAQVKQAKDSAKLSVQADLNEKDKVIDSLHLTLRDKDDAIRKREEEISSLQEELRLLRLADEMEEQAEQLLSSDEDLLDLPEEGVLFVGGRPALVNRLKQEHPSWKFAAKVSELPDTINDIVFFYYRHSGHKVRYKLDSACTNGVIYCQGTNLGLLHENMRMMYTSFMSSQTG